jgi:hypothetical protein
MLDLSMNGAVAICQIESYNPRYTAGELLEVSWNATARPFGFVPVIGGAIFATVPPAHLSPQCCGAPDRVGPGHCFCENLGC